MAPAQPRVGRRTVEALLAANAEDLRERSLVLVHGRYAPGAPPRFTVTLDGEARRVHVRDEASVLGVVAALHEHRSAAAPSDVLVVTTGVDDEQLGWDVRGRAVRRKTLTVENAEVVLQRFAATTLDPRMYREPWLLEALVEAEPAEGGWPRVGGVLTRDAALRALTAERLGLRAFHGSSGQDGQVTLDADTLLAWSRTPAGPTRFAELGATERAELKKWLAEVAGPAVPVLLSLAEAGLGHDALPLGLLGAALRDPAAQPDTVLALGGLFGQVMPRRSELAVFTDAVEGTLTRWIADARTSQDARLRVDAVLERADELADKAGLTPGLTASRFLPSSFTAQLRRTVAEARRSPAAGEAALADLLGHTLAGLRADQVQAAETAVRVARWLSGPEPAVTSVAAAVRAHVSDWGWVDRALTVLWAGDPGGDLETGRDLRALYEQARERRQRLDQEFARRLAVWAAHATAQHPDGCLVVENVLDTVVRPLTGQAAPLVLVLDGMSSAVAAQLGEEAERDGWREIVPRPEPGQVPARLAAVSMLPSVTRVSRASLLAGEAADGGQSTETSGFTAFWKRRRRTAVLFHKAAIGGEAGHALSHDLMTALASDAVVGVVLNTIDEALDNGRQGRGTTWSLADVTHLRELLAAARSYGRPVVLVSDHGHVLERRSRADAPTAAADGAESARWRTGDAAGKGEIAVDGPRVREGGGAVILPWREDIRYTGRRAGYHGGASLAEVTVPVLVLLPPGEEAPKDWVPLPRELSTPGWWRTHVTREVPQPAAVPAGHPVTPSPARPAEPAEPAGSAGSAPTVDARPSARAEAAPPVTESLGSTVVSSEVYAAQKEYVRKAPEAKVVAAVVDALVSAGGTMSPAALAAAISATGRVRRNIEGFVATVQRLLNVEGYPVLGFIDGGHAVKLDVPLLREQFLPKQNALETEEDGQPGEEKA
ncbi:BREX-2 system phosphatase PglZ [Streptomyces silvisoli]|uniref:BREX-2 system phosphatase PglZ n=1 Tax=Streptomyces silvisoli TaxID=3034235 RepID=A0ABT5ZW22_9ACTN|nr:BREX-2 system phosphatase PglZ [Streptomyces silvisoli]MDF3294022.1 BREX-2 system phosphatase PglZ [Streptomyces silvisoli]